MGGSLGVGAADKCSWCELCVPLVCAVCTTGVSCVELLMSALGASAVCATGVSCV